MSILLTRKTPLAAIALLLLAGAAHAKDGFESVHCDSAIVKVLVGRGMSNEPVATIERRHSELSLKNLGGDEISDHLILASWLICGREYELLSDSHDVVVDVLSFPAHAKTSPQFIGECQANGKKLGGTVIAVLDNRANDERTDRTLLPAKEAWRIDEKRARFIKSSEAGLTCPRSGISTADGGP
jgi:hypothetical protein